MAIRRMHGSGIESLKIKAFLACIIEELLFESIARENFYFLLFLDDVHQFISEVGTTDIVLDNAFLKGKAVMYRSSNSLFKT